MRRRVVGVLIIIGIIAALLVGCQSNENISDSNDTSICIYVDPDTGINYVIFKGTYKGGICPRYNADGSLMITENK